MSTAMMNGESCVLIGSADEGLCGGAVEQCRCVEMAEPGAGRCRSSRPMKNVGGGSSSSARSGGVFSVCNDAKPLGAFVFLC